MAKDKHPEEEEPKPKFKIVDRRRIGVDGPADSEPEPEPPVKQANGPAEPAKDQKVEIPTSKDTPAEEPAQGKPVESEDPLTFRNVSLSFLQTLSTIAWIHMGLVPHPQTQLLAKKNEEARKAINMLEIIFQQAKLEYPPEVNAEIAGLIQDLKTNYVNAL
jgi:hypothetical protein